MPSALIVSRKMPAVLLNLFPGSSSLHNTSLKTVPTKTSKALLAPYRISMLAKTTCSSALTFYLHDF